MFQVECFQVAQAVQYSLNFTYCRLSVVFPTHLCNVSGILENLFMCQCIFEKLFLRSKNMLCFKGKCHKLVSCWAEFIR